MSRYSVSSLRCALATVALAVSAWVPAAAQYAGPRLRIIGTNDLHGALESHRVGGVMRGGIAALAATIERAEAECTPPDCHWILLDGGDEFQGTLASNLAYGRPVSLIFDQLHYTAAALGNHEFDWGQDTLRARMRDETYDVMAANVRFEDGRDVPWIRDDTLVTRGPFKIGIIGLVTRSTKTAAKASVIQGLRFDDPAPIVDSLAADLRARGANTIVVVAHAGGFCDQNGATNCHGEIFDMVHALAHPVDAVVAGHTHTLVNAEIDGVPVVQAYSSGTAIDVVDIPLDRSRGAVRHEVRSVLPDSIAPDPIIARMAAAAEAAVATRAASVVATVAREIPESDESPLGDVLADAMRAAGHADFGVMNHGGVRAPLHAGTVHYSDAFEVQPFNNVLYKLTASGADMRRYFEKIVSGRRPNAWVSGIHFSYDSTRAAGSRITALSLSDGRPFDDAATYTVVINDFMLTGGSGLGFPVKPLAQQSVDVTDLDAFIAYLESARQPFEAPTDVRIQAASKSD